MKNIMWTAIRLKDLGGGGGGGDGGGGISREGGGDGRISREGGGGIIRN